MPHSTAPAHRFRENGRRLSPLNTKPQPAKDGHHQEAMGNKPSQHHFQRRHRDKHRDASPSGASSRTETTLSGTGSVRSDKPGLPSHKGSEQPVRDRKAANRPGANFVDTTATPSKALSPPNHNNAPAAMASPVTVPCQVRHKYDVLCIVEPEYLP